MFKSHLHLTTLLLFAAVTPCAMAQADGSAPSTLNLRTGGSQIFKTPWQVKRVSITQPNIAAVKVLDPGSILVSGTAVGSTDLFLWNEDEESLQIQVNVTADLRELKKTLGQLFPGSQLEVSQSGEVVIVRGTLARAHDAKQLPTFLETSGLKFVDQTSVAGVQQVQIQVRVAEASRTAIKALGVNAFQVGEDAFGATQIGPSAGGPLNPIDIGVPGGSLARPDLPFFFPSDVTTASGVTIFGGLVDENLMAFVQALAENQYLRILAEPTLVALSGEPASFLAGGEFPIPVVQGGSGGGSTSIQIIYKEFGVRLNFMPTVLGEGLIRLRVEPEVSELTDTGAVEIEGFRVPGIVTRRAKTTLELKSGETFAMAGLLNSRREARNSSLPILGDIPILGALFRSVRYTRGETELVVMVTASLVTPMSPSDAPPLPGTLEQPENDWEIFVEADFDGTIPVVASKSSPSSLKRLGLDRLRGPGAWATHDNDASHSVGRED